MDNYIDKKKKLLGLKKQIIRMPNNIKRANMIEGYSYLLGYLREIDSIQSNNKQYDIDDEFIKKYDRHVVNATQKKIDEIKSLAPILYAKYSELINEYHENDFCSFEFSVDGRCDANEMYNYLFEYMNILGKDVTKLYNDMVNSGNIFLLPETNYLGVSMNSLPVDKPCIIINSIEKYFDFYVTLLHELGHCYQFYLQRNHSHFESFNPFMETTSLLFEKLFCEFLKTKNRYQQNLKDYELEDHIYFLNDISISRLLCILLMNNDIQNIHAYDLSYDSHFTNEELIREVQYDCGYVMDNKLNMELTEFHYSLGNIFATYFIDKMKKDFCGTWKEYKDFICMVDNYPLEEILDKYFDVPLMKNYIKSYMKSYRTR